MSQSKNPRWSTFKLFQKCSLEIGDFKSGFTSLAGTELHAGPKAMASHFPATWPRYPFKSFSLTLRLSNKSALCKLKMALPPQRWNLRPVVDNVVYYQHNKSMDFYCWRGHLKLELWPLQLFRREGNCVVVSYLYYIPTDEKSTSAALQSHPTPWTVISIGCNGGRVFSRSLPPRGTWTKKQTYCQDLKKTFRQSIYRGILQCLYLMTTTVTAVRAYTKTPKLTSKQIQRQLPRFYYFQNMNFQKGHLKVMWCVVTNTNAI